MKYFLACSLVFLLSLLSASSALAVPKASPCKAFKINYCIDKSLISKSIRSKLPKNSKFVAPLQVIRLKNGPIVLPPDAPSDGVATPLILIPAGSVSKPFCYLIGNEHKCIVLSSFNDCPRVYTFTDENRNTWTCDVDCDNRRPNGDPDENGNCDCDIDQSTCRAGFN